MKSDKGITMVSLAIYIALIFIAIGILATITSSVRKNVNDTNKDGENIAEFNKFNMYFIKEIKDEQNEVTSINSNTITFSNGKTFFYDSQNKVIKLIENGAQIEIASNIESCSFSKALENGKDVINVTIKPQDLDSITKEYVLNTNTNTNNNFENEKDYIKKVENVATE